MKYALHVILTVQISTKDQSNAELSFCFSEAPVLPNNNIVLIHENNPHPKKVLNQTFVFHVDVIPDNDMTPNHNNLFRQSPFHIFRQRLSLYNHNHNKL